MGPGVSGGGGSLATIRLVHTDPIPAPAPAAARSGRHSRSPGTVGSMPSPCPEACTSGEGGVRSAGCWCRQARGGAGRGAPTASRTQASKGPHSRSSPHPTLVLRAHGGGDLEGGSRGQDPRPEAEPAWFPGEGPGPPGDCGPPAQLNPDGGPAALQLLFAGRFLKRPDQLKHPAPS